MNVLFWLALVLLTDQPIVRLTAPRPNHRHWCSQPTRTLRWLNRKIKVAMTSPGDGNGWEVHQGRLWGQEVFILHLFRQNGQHQGFLLYNHYGEHIYTGERSDSLQLTDLIGDRLLATSPNRLRK